MWDDVRTVVAADSVFLVREVGGPPSDARDAPPALLLLHGVPETSSCWRDVAPALADGRRVLAPDLPGLGGSTWWGTTGAACSRWRWPGGTRSGCGGSAW